MVGMRRGNRKAAVLRSVQKKNQSEWIAFQHDRTRIPHSRPHDAAGHRLLQCRLCCPQTIMKILLITDDLPPHILGGSGRIAWETTKGLRSRGHDVSILTAAVHGVFPDSIEGIRVHTIA